MPRIALIFLGFFALAGCTTPESPFASDALVQSTRYTHPAPTSVSLVTVRNVGGHETGAHTALIINGSERVIWDPAGSFVHPAIAERNDLITGANPAVVDYFIDYHTRINYFSVVQTVDVPPAVAQDLINRAKNYGAVPAALCARSTSDLLTETPGFESIRGSLFPDRLQDQFARLPNIRTVEFRDDDAEQKSSTFFRWAGQPPRYNIE